MILRELKNKFNCELAGVLSRGEINVQFSLLCERFLGSKYEKLSSEKSDLLYEQQQDFEKALHRLKKNEPIHHIIGETYFFKNRIKVSKYVLIPRPETEELVDIIVRENRSGRVVPTILDACTGSGCIAIAIQSEIPNSHVTGVDISEKAIAIAKENAKLNKVEVDFEKKDVLEWTPDQKFDVLVSNPPYVLLSEKDTIGDNVKLYEPHIALFVEDKDPLLFFKRIAKIGLTSLKAAGKIYFELNPLTAQELGRYMKSIGFIDVEIIEDMSGNERFLKAVKP